MPIRESCNTKAAGRKYGGGYIYLVGTHLIKHVVPMSALPLAVVRIGEPLGLCEQVAWPGKKGDTNMFLRE